MLLGMVLIFSGATTRFHLFPATEVVHQREYKNQTQAAVGNVTAIAICIGAFFLISSGIRKGFRPQTMKPDLHY
jgi:hypothetical protein